MRRVGKKGVRNRKNRKSAGVRRSGVSFGWIGKSILTQTQNGYYPKHTGRVRIRLIRKMCRRVSDEVYCIKEDSLHKTPVG
uniref:Uncharacterized protein n=1 Tax=Candidatus Kentrum sp. FM TaxID=2126340 RepID=A0A450TT29_9GAMM|nr:MAG: hypothetical protein BECKFM1743A_GA0114220_106062 [Candidatus Kentron sp. FM]VFJ73001.1 MAG: hypothetical protein BECKFM1743C_GA0114222_106923 [Candidatus Kentron sp. FM]VFK20815.1 MAG: hypothetical protein BECKFM1743B_GA0114221_107321 [Candidatus Kentron sp. FM]